MKLSPDSSALLVIDMQQGFDDPAWGPRNNPHLETRVAALIAGWRAAGAPVVHVFHDSASPAGHLRPGTAGNAPKPEALPREGERIYRKQTNNGFVGTSLDTDLRISGIATLAIIGLTTNHCVSTNARMAGNLGYLTFVVSDATATFARAHLDGRMRTATDVHEAALSDLQDEFAQVVTADWLLDALSRSPHHA